MGRRGGTLRRAQLTVVVAAWAYAAATRSGMDVQLQVLTGGHTWQVWGRGLGSALPGSVTGRA